jgi:hypothetical protein
MGIRKRLSTARASWNRYWDEYDQMMKDSPIPILPYSILGGIGYPGASFPGLFMTPIMQVMPHNSWLQIGENAPDVIAALPQVDFCEVDSVERTVPAGSKVLLILKEIPSSGYSHEILDFPPGISVIGDSFEDRYPMWEPDIEHAIEREKLGDEGLAGGDAKRGLILSVEDNPVHEVTVCLTCCRPWEPADDPSITTKTLTLRLTQPSSLSA